jgi:hypothetical protein
MNRDRSKEHAWALGWGLMPVFIIKGLPMFMQLMVMALFIGWDRDDSAIEKCS